MLVFKLHFSGNPVYFNEYGGIKPKFTISNYLVSIWKDQPYFAWQTAKKSAKLTDPESIIFVKKQDYVC